jgi:hypothetical protein
VIVGARHLSNENGSESMYCFNWITLAARTTHVNGNYLVVRTRAESPLRIPNTLNSISPKEGLPTSQPKRGQSRIPS